MTNSCKDNLYFHLHLSSKFWTQAYKFFQQMAAPNTSKKDQFLAKMFCKWKPTSAKNLGQKFIIFFNRWQHKSPLKAFKMTYSRNGNLYFHLNLSPQFKTQAYKFLQQMAALNTSKKDQFLAKEFCKWNLTSAQNLRQKFINFFNRWQHISPLKAVEMTTFCNGNLYFNLYLSCQFRDKSSKKFQ